MEQTVISRTYHNESQETMFDNEISTAADEMVDAIKDFNRARENKEKCSIALIDVMLKQNPSIRSLSFDGGSIALLHKDSQEKIRVKFDTEGA